MKMDWKSLKKFVVDTKLYNFVNYVEFPNNYYVWLSYQNESFYNTLDKGSVDCADFETNIKPKAILKNDIASDGQTYSKVTHVTAGRVLRALFVTIETCTKNHDDATNYIKIKLYDENGRLTEDGTQAVKTCVDFGPDFTYEIFGGGLTSMEAIEENFYISSIIAPEIPQQYGGMVYNVINKKVLTSTEVIFITGVGTSEVPYKQQMSAANVLRIEVRHNKGKHQKFEVQLQYYANQTIVK